MYKNLFSVAKDCCLDDGLFEIFILKNQNSILFFIEIVRIMLDIKSNNSRVEYHKAQDLNIKTHYCFAHIDGEKMKFRENLNFKIENSAINIYSCL